VDRLHVGLTDVTQLAVGLLDRGLRSVGLGRGLAERRDRVVVLLERRVDGLDLLVRGVRRVGAAVAGRGLRRTLFRLRAVEQREIVWVTVLFEVVGVVVDPSVVVVPVVVVLGCVIVTVVNPFSTVAVTSAPLARGQARSPRRRPLRGEEETKAFQHV